MLKKPKIIKGNLILTRIIRENHDYGFFCSGCKYRSSLTHKCRIASRSTPEDEEAHSLCCKTTPITKQGKIVYVYAKEKSCSV